MSKVIGMNSGSSVDAIDVVVLGVENDDGVIIFNKVIDSITYEWPEDIYERIVKAIDIKVSIAELTRLNFITGAIYAKAAEEVMIRNSLDSSSIDVIGVDGQTIYQESTSEEKDSSSQSYVDKFKSGIYACTLQIGEGAVIANYTCIPTVTQFRPADIALGGTGAPLMQYLDYILFRNIAPIVTLNIGGIANFQLVNKEIDKMMAFDTGPGNVMIDYIARHKFNKSYDKNGEIAKMGNVNPSLLDELLDHPFLKRVPPRNASRLDFTGKYIENIIDKYKDVSSKDFMATFCEYTAICIVNAFKKFIFPQKVKRIIVSGGGLNNLTLMESIRSKLPMGVDIVKSDEYGVPSKFKEAIKFGVLGFATINMIPNNIPSCSGASGYTIMGKISYPFQKKYL